MWVFSEFLIFSHYFTSLWGPLLSGFGSRPCDFHNRKHSMSFNTQGHLIILIKLSDGCHMKVQSLLVTQFSSTSKSIVSKYVLFEFPRLDLRDRNKTKILAELSFVVIMHFSIKYFALELVFSGLRICCKDSAECYPASSSSFILPLYMRYYLTTVHVSRLRNKPLIHHY